MRPMNLTGVVPIAAALVSGIFLLVGYVIQKSLEHRRNVAEKRRETYSMLLKNMFTAIEARLNDQTFDRAEEVFWKAQIALYGSDEVIYKFAAFGRLLSSVGEPRRSWELKVVGAFDDLLLAMRRDITPKSRVTAAQLREISPLLLSEVQSSESRQNRFSWTP